MTVAHTLQLALLAIALLLLHLAVSVTGRRIYRDASERRRQRREAKLRPLMLALVADEDPDLSVFDGLSRGDVKVAESLAWQFLSKVRGSSRDALVEWLVAHGEVEKARRRTHRPGSVGRARAAEKLGAAGVKSTSPDVSRLLTDDNAEVRIVAARALGKLGDAEAVGALLEAAEGHKSVPVSLISMAILHIGPSAVGQLTEGLTSESETVRLICAHLLGMHGSISATRALTEMVQHDPSDAVRERAIAALGRIGSPQAVGALDHALSSDHTRAIRVAAAEALGQIGGSDAIESLNRALQGDDHNVGMAAAEALTKSGQQGEEVLTLATSTDGAVKLRAEHWLSRQRAQSVRPRRARPRPVGGRR